MAGFDYERGRSNNMVAAEREGKITIGRWAKQYGITAASAEHVMQPDEAHHTGTGRRGRSRLTPVIHADVEPSAQQIQQMKELDRQRRAAKKTPPQVFAGCSVRWKTFGHATGQYGKILRRNCVPQEHVEHDRTVEIYAHGRIASDADSKLHTRCGLVVVQDGRLIAQANLNPIYDDLASIVSNLTVAP